MPSELTGRALDAAIAEKLGWTEVREQELTPHTTAFGERIGDRYWVGCPPECVAGSMMHVPHYSTDPRAAFELVEAMLGRGLRFLIKPGKSAGIPGHWCSFDPPDSPLAYRTHADTSCLAIALAAHTALGGG